MAKFKTSSKEFLVLLSGKTIGDNYYTSIRLEVKGCITKKSNLSSWVENPEGTQQEYYGVDCFLPENKKARKFLKEYVNGKTFHNKLVRSINAHYKFETVEGKKIIFDNMIVKINHVIDNSFNK